MKLGQLASLAPILLIIVAMYFLMIRPQNKKRKETENMRRNLRTGDHVITIGGIKGKITKIVDETTLEIEVGTGSKTKLQITRWAVSTADNAAPNAGSGAAAAEEETKASKSKPKKLDEE